jgi:hypothetical protein
VVLFTKPTIPCWRHTSFTDNVMKNAWTFVVTMWKSMSLFSFSG